MCDDSPVRFAYLIAVDGQTFVVRWNIGDELSARAIVRCWLIEKLISYRDHITLLAIIGS